MVRPVTACLAGEYLTLPLVLGLGFVVCALGQDFSLVRLSCARHCRNAVHKLGLK